MPSRKWPIRKKGRPADATQYQPLRVVTLEFSPEFALALREYAKSQNVSKGLVVETISRESESELQSLSLKYQVTPS